MTFANVFRAFYAGENGINISRLPNIATIGKYFTRLEILLSTKVGEKEEEKFRCRVIHDENLQSRGRGGPTTVAMKLVGQERLRFCKEVNIWGLYSSLGDVFLAGTPMARGEKKYLPAQTFRSPQITNAAISKSLSCYHATNDLHYLQTARTGRAWFNLLDISQKQRNAMLLGG